MNCCAGSHKSSAAHKLDISRIASLQALCRERRWVAHCGDRSTRAHDARSPRRYSVSACASSMARRREGRACLVCSNSADMCIRLLGMNGMPPLSSTTTPFALQLADDTFSIAETAMHSIACYRGALSVSTRESTLPRRRCTLAIFCRSWSCSGCIVTATAL